MYFFFELCERLRNIVSGGSRFHLRHLQTVVNGK